MGDTTECFGAMLDREREIAGVSHAEFSRKLGLNARATCKWADGQRPAPHLVLPAMAALCIPAPRQIELLAVYARETGTIPAMGLDPQTAVTLLGVLEASGRDCASR